MSINKELNDYVTSNGIKQSYICEQTGIHPDIVSRILREARKITAEEFLKICNALNLDPRDFNNPKVS